MKTAQQEKKRNNSPLNESRQASKGNAWPAVPVFQTKPVTQKIATEKEEEVLQAKFPTQLKIEPSNGNDQPVSAQSSIQQSQTRSVSAPFQFEKRVVQKKELKQGIDPANSTLVHQLVLIKSLFDPKNDKVKSREVDLDTSNYTLEENIDIITHGRNLTYRKNSSYDSFADEFFDRYSSEEWMKLLIEQPAKVLTLANMLEKLNKKSPIREIARIYLRSIKDELEQKTFLIAKKLAFLDVNESKEYDVMFKRAIEQRTEKNRLEELAKKKKLQQRAANFIQIATYFYAEIPDEFSDEAFEFLMTINADKDKLGVYDDEPGENLTDGSVNLFIRKIIRAAQDLFIMVGKESPGSIPATFMDSLSPDYRKGVVDIKQRIQVILAPYAVLVADCIPNAIIKYRGSLTDGIKNFTKSKPISSGPVLMNFGKKAVEINIEAYDIDAFVEIPDSLWNDWEKHGIIPDKKNQAIKGKITLEDWIPELEKLGQRGNYAAYYTVKIVKNIRIIENRVQQDLRALKGYKTKPNTDVPDFEMVLQPVDKTKKSEAYGKPYPLGELSRGGSAYQELMARFDQLREHGLDEEAAWLPEKTEVIAKPKNTSLKNAYDAINNPYRMLEMIDLSGLDPALTVEQTATLITSIENGHLPFLNTLKVDAQSITVEQREKIKALLPVFFSLTDKESLNF